MEKLKSYDSNALFTNKLAFDDVFTVEDFSEEHEMMAGTTKSFVDQDVLPVLEEIEKQHFEPAVDLIRKAGELGLLGVDIPEEYDGLELDKVSSIIIMEEMAKARSFSVTYGGQVGIGSLPIVFYGTEEQKDAYLPAVATGEKIGSYALTEPEAGTDAVSIKTSARLSEDETHYIINGEKQFITNSSFADFFILYAKIDGDKFTAFIVERDSEGLSVGPEEQKMGLKGSSTTSLVLEDVKVPAANLLGEIGRGHLIAFNILNIGRHKISASCLGTSKRALELAVEHVSERKQFKRPLSEFNLIKEKIADMAVKIFAMESMVYRTGGEFENGEKYSRENDIPFSKVLKNYAAECSVNKIFASEALDEIVDEAVQMHGGYGYISEYEVETLYRDSRINRIFEGTNEINRVVVANTVLQNAADLPDDRTIEDDLSGSLNVEWALLSQMRKLTKSLVGQVHETYEQPAEEQELLGCIADNTKDIYALESSLLRMEKIRSSSRSKKVEQQQRMTTILAQQTAENMVSRAMSVFSVMDEAFKEKTLRILDLLKVKGGPSTDSIAIKRQIANHVISAGY